MSEGKHLCFNLLPQIEIFKVDLVWGWFRNPKMWKFLVVRTTIFYEILIQNDIHINKQIFKCFFSFFAFFLPFCREWQVTLIEWHQEPQWPQWPKPRCTYKHLSLFSLIKRWVLNWGTLTCELFTDPAGLSSSFKRASSRNNHNRHVELSEVTGIVGIPNSEMKNTHSASC